MATVCKDGCITTLSNLLTDFQPKQLYEKQHGRQKQQPKGQQEWAKGDPKPVSQAMVLMPITRARGCPGNPSHCWPQDYKPMPKPRRAGDTHAGLATQGPSGRAAQHFPERPGRGSWAAAAPASQRRPRGRGRRGSLSPKRVRQMRSSHPGRHFRTVSPDARNKWRRGGEGLFPAIQ